METKRPAGMKVLSLIFVALILYVSFVFFISKSYLTDLKSRSLQQAPSVCSNMQGRRQLIQETCRAYQRQFVSILHPLRPSYFMIVDNKHKVIYCMIPKLACTTFQKLMV